MGLIDWFTGLFAESPPEQLVLGAELRCPYGSEHSYLYIATDHIDIDNLPEACVEDCIVDENIKFFGECFGGRNCKDKMELAGLWENPEPQTMVVNGKEIITTKSTLLCKAEGMLIEAVTSGQDKIVAERIALFLEVEEKYPGLLAILMDPYGSLYLQEGMYETALRFIEDRMECNGGEMWIPGLFNKEDPEGELVRAALERLLTDCDASSVNRFLDGLETTGVQYGMYDEVEGWETVTLNDKMMDMLKEDCKATAERIKTSSFARWVEENKRFVDLMADGATQLAYATVIYSSTLKQPIKGTGEDSLDKIKDETNNKEGKGGTSTNSNRYCLSGEEHYEAYKEMFGAENVEWTSRDTLSSADRLRIQDWAYPPTDELYLKYKNVYQNDLYFNQATGDIRWPIDDGFAEYPETITLQSGTIIDRYGSDYGTFTSPQGTPYANRALARVQN